MADLNSTVATMSQGIQFSENGTPNLTTVDANVSNNSAAVLQCFVCDAKVQGRHYALATCRTQSTRTRVIEKLGELVGERYMVVISEDDVICRSCANLINTLDRLESEMKGVKSTVLRYLEVKYCLEEGELLNNNESVKLGQPPQVTQTGEIDRKRKAVNLLDESVSKGKQKKSTLLQCDKCRYTTDYNTFMIHHIRQHVNQKINCDKCGVQFVGNSQHNNSHSCTEKVKETVLADQNVPPPEQSGTPADDINIALENGDLTENPLINTENQTVVIKKDVERKVFDLPNLEADGIPAEYVVPEPNEEFAMQEQEQEQEQEHKEELEQDQKQEQEEEQKLGQEQKLEQEQGQEQEQELEREQEQEQELEQEQEQEQEISDNEKPIILAETELNEDLFLKKKELSSKQILTVGEDGSLEMMEMEVWQEKNAILKPDESSKFN